MERCGSFFILSGFLIGNILLKNKHSPSLFRTFYIRRFCRIIPIYYLLIFIFFIITATQLYNSKAAIFSDPIPIGGFLLLIQNFYMAHYDHFGPQALTPTWSLCVEEQFYLIIPLLIYVINRKHAWMLAVAGIILAIIARIFATNFHQDYTLLACRIDSPMIGFLLAWLHQFTSFREWVSKHLSWAWASLGLLISLSAVLYIKSDPGIYGHTLLGAVFGLIVLIVLNTQGGFTKILSAPWLLETGKLSYFIYLYHQLINGLLHLLLLKHLSPVLDSYKAIAVTLASLLITYILAAASYKYLEKPIINYSHQFKY